MREPPAAHTRNPADPVFGKGTARGHEVRAREVHHQPSRPHLAVDPSRSRRGRRVLWAVRHGLTSLIAARQIPHERLESHIARLL